MHFKQRKEIFLQQLFKHGKQRPPSLIKS